MATLTEQLAAIDLAIASGAQSVRVDGREVTYRSVEELRSARAHVESQIAQQAGTPVTRLRRVATSHGYVG